MEIFKKALNFLDLASDDALKDFIAAMIDSGEIEEITGANFDGSLYSEAIISNNKKEAILTLYVNGGQYKFKIYYWSVKAPDKFKEGVLYTFLKEFDGCGLNDKKDVKEFVTNYFKKYGAIVAPLN